MDKGRFSEAITFAKKLVGRSEVNYGAYHTNTADALDNLSKSYRKGSNYISSAAACARALQIREKALGPDHSDTAITLSNLAILYNMAGNHTAAEPLFLWTIKFREKVLGPEHPSTARAMHDLASLYRSVNNFSKAEPLYWRTLKVREKVLGPEHADTARTLTQLAWLYHSMGEYAKAESLYQRELKITEKVAGPAHPDTAVILASLGGLYFDIGDYAKAEMHYQRSLSLMEKSVGREHTDTTIPLSNLAELYISIGDYAKAEEMYQRSLKIVTQSFGLEHPDTSTAMNNLAVLYRHMGEYAKAVPLYEQSLAISKIVMGPQHPSTAIVFNNLASLYMSMGNSNKSKPLYQQSLKIQEEVLGPEHPDTATTLNNLASFYRSTDDFEKAEPLFERSLKIFEKVLGARHPKTLEPLNNLSLLQLDLRKFDDAMSLGRKFKATSERALGNILAFAGERQRMNYQNAIKAPVANLLATLSSAGDLAEFMLRTKGIVLDSLLEDELAARASKEPAVREAYDELQAAGRLLIKMQMEAPRETSPESLNRLRSEQERLEGQVETLQKMLARNVTSLGQVRRSLRITVADVQRALPKDTVLLEFVRYGHHLARGKYQIRYGVVMISNETVALSGSQGGDAVWVAIGSAETIEPNLQNYSRMMRGDKIGDPRLLHTVYQDLIAPIQMHLPKSTTTLVISPEGELNFVNFATLVDAQGQFLGERYSTRYVASGRDLVFGQTSQTQSRSFAAFASPAFAAKPGVAEARDAVQLSMQHADRRDFTEITLRALPNSSLEAQFLKERSSAWNLKGAVHVGAEASELQVKSVKSPYILHLATHGFFLPEDSSTNRPSIPTQALDMQRQREPVVFHNPMQRSGLAFAGAQFTLDAWKRGEVPDTENDGILMAQEVGTMDLKDTWLVVLSACDTGIGEARSGEGVLGLRRGFVQAGAQNLLMTLWPISDKWSVDIMKAFYEKAMVSGDAAQAMAEVQAEWLGRLRKEKGVLMAARLAGPFVLSTRGRQPSR